MSEREDELNECQGYGVVQDSPCSNLGIIKSLRAQLAEARDAALEEAAAVCDGLVSHADTLAKGEVSIILGVCGDRIRAMKNQKP